VKDLNYAHDAKSHAPSPPLFFVVLLRDTHCMRVVRLGVVAHPESTGLELRFGLCFGETVVITAVCHVVAGFQGLRAGLVEIGNHFASRKALPSSGDVSSLTQNETRMGASGGTKPWTFRRNAIRRTLPGICMYAVHPTMRDPIGYTVNLQPFEAHANYAATSTSFARAGVLGA